MKKQVWVNVVGVMVIVMGCFGAIGAVQTLSFPKMIAMQKEIMIPQLKRQMAEGYQGQSQYLKDQTLKMIDTMSRIPAWFDSWCLVSGAMALLLAFGFIFSGINLLRLKRVGIVAFYWVAGLDIAFLILRTVVGFSASAIIGMVVAMGSVFAVILTAGLLIVVVCGGKEAFDEAC